MAEAKLNWSTAQVRDGTLSVELDGELEKAWKHSFKTTVRLLGHGEWGEVEVKKGAVRVTDVTPGTEEKLRHYLESVVEQANASQAPPEAEDRERDGRQEDGQTADEGPDSEMTEHFRAFAEAESHDDD